MGYRSRGHVIRELLRLLRSLDRMKAKTVKDISTESGMELRQAYRWLKALEGENMVQKFDKSPARYSQTAPACSQKGRGGLLDTGLAPILSLIYSTVTYVG